MQTSGGQGIQQMQEELKKDTSVEMKIKEAIDRHILKLDQKFARQLMQFEAQSGAVIEKNNQKLLEEVQRKTEETQYYLKETHSFHLAELTKMNSHQEMYEQAH